MSVSSVVFVHQRLAILVVLFSFCSAENAYYVTPSDDIQCPGEPCHTLSEYGDDYFRNVTSNLTIIFLPGNHTLDHVIIIETVEGYTTLFGMSSSPPEVTSSIICNRPAGFFFTNITELHINALVFSSCGFNNSAAVSLHLVQWSNISNCTFQESVNTSPWLGINARYGGALYVGNSTVTLSWNTFMNNLAATFGGALYINQNSTTMFSKNVFENNSAVYGGALFVDKNSTITFSMNTFIDNSAAFGGAVYIITSNADITSNAFCNNTATTSAGTIYIWNSTLTIIGNTFNNSSAVEYGGALFVSEKSSDLTIVGNTFQSNRADLGGAAISVVGNSTLNLTRNTFENNYATEGGALFINNNGVLTITENVFESNYAYHFGGVASVGRNSTVAMMGNTLENNHAAINGGALFVYNSTIIFSTNTFENNSAVYGGSLFMENSSSTFSMNTFVNNSATFGGAFYIKSSNTNLISNTFCNNIATTSAGTICVWESTLTLIGNVFKNSSAVDYGGAIFVGAESNNLTITGNTFRSNRANLGGAVCVALKSTLNLTRNNFENNYAAEGGALFINRNGILIVKENIFHNNYAVRYGGVAVVGRNSTATMIRNTLENNYASSNGGALYVNRNSALTLMGNSFQNNSAHSNGGAILAARNSTITARENTFENSSAIDGGALFIDNSSLTLTRNKFLNNSAEYYGGALVSTLNSVATLIENMFRFNLAKYGGAIDVDRSSILDHINNTLQNNTAHLGGAINIDRNSVATFIGDKFEKNLADYGGAIFVKRNCTLAFVNNRFENNSGVFGGGVVFSMQSTLNLTNNNFSKNSAKKGGTTFCVESNLNFYENHSICDNTAEYGGGIAALDCRVELKGNVIFRNNSASYGGGLYGDGLQLSGYAQFIHNTAREGGGGAYASRSTFRFEQNVTFMENSAVDGGGLLFTGDSELYLLPNASVYFMNNRAKQRGGALKIDNNPLTSCAKLSNEVDSLSDCFFQIQTQREYLNTSASEIKELHNVRMYFHNNTALEAGAAVYGGSVDHCKLNNIQTLSAECLRPFCPTSGQVFDIISLSGYKEEPLSISSDPVYICLCSGGKADCSVSSVRIPVYPGGTTKVSMIAFGERNGTTPAIVHNISPRGSVVFKSPENTQSVTNSCTNLTYTVQTNAVGTSQVITLYAEGGCLPRERTLLNSSIPTNTFDMIVEILPCPVGFQLSNTDSACTCEQRLLPFTNTCRINDKTVLRAQNINFWMGYSRDNDSKGLILHPHCPFHYCSSQRMYIEVEDSDMQCSDHRIGLLCGQCDQNYSLALGSSRCLQCSNSRLVLLVGFAFAGIVLVFVLLLLRLTVAAGTIDSLIFYANVLGANSALFFPPKMTNNVLIMFIAWINLDLGIETCFYDGMDAYAKVWLQFVFPFYVWALIGTIVLVSHYSSRVASVLGRNPVAVLATLFLLSYAKLLRTIIAAFSFTLLEYPNDSKISVWLYDGNIRYLSSKHIPLFTMSVICLVFLFLPYTILLLFSQWFRTKSKWKVLLWINDYRILPFVDAYHAPYTTKYRYWTGLMLLLRCILFLVFAFNALGVSSINLLAIITASSVKFLVIMCSYLFGNGIHKTHYLSVLEILFNLNLLLLSATTLYIQLAGGNQTTATLLSVGIAFAVFIITVVCHLVQQIKSAPYLWEKICSRSHDDYDPVPLTDDETGPLGSARPSSPLSAGAVPNIIEIDLREILANELREPCMEPIQ